MEEDYYCGVMCIWGQRQLFAFSKYHPGTNISPYQCKHIFYKLKYLFISSIKVSVFVRFILAVNYVGVCWSWWKALRCILCWDHLSVLHLVLAVPMSTFKRSLKVSPYGVHSSLENAGLVSIYSVTGTIKPKCLVRCCEGDPSKRLQVVRS